MLQVRQKTKNQNQNTRLERGDVAYAGLMFSEALFCGDASVSLDVGCGQDSL